MYSHIVALFTRAWIEIGYQEAITPNHLVALFTRAWIEIAVSYSDYSSESGRPLHEGVD